VVRGRYGGVSVRVSERVAAANLADLFTSLRPFYCLKITIHPIAITLSSMTLSLPDSGVYLGPRDPALKSIS
jgi:hypothetical protein